MAILKILDDSDPILRKKCREVDKIMPRTIRLLDDMKETLNSVSGIGLAAPQVGVLRRIAIVESDDGTLYELINPQIIARSEKRQNEIEGCLSIPNKWGVTDRPDCVTVTATDRNGNKYTVTGCGLTARAFCHEIDHLDGILFTDHSIKILTEDDIIKLNEEAEKENGKAEENNKKENEKKQK